MNEVLLLDQTSDLSISIIRNTQKKNKRSIALLIYCQYATPTIAHVHVWNRQNCILLNNIKKTSIET